MCTYMRSWANFLRATAAAAEDNHHKIDEKESGDQYRRPLHENTSLAVMSTAKDLQQSSFQWGPA